MTIEEEINNALDILRNNGWNPSFVPAGEKRVFINVYDCKEYMCKKCGYGTNVSNTEMIHLCETLGFKLIEIWEHDLQDEQKVVKMVKEAEGVTVP